MKLNDDNQQSGAQVVMSVFNTLLWSLLVLFPFVQVRMCVHACVHVSIHVCVLCAACVHVCVPLCVCV